jgi:hypothetical protein
MSTAGFGVSTAITRHRFSKPVLLAIHLGSGYAAPGSGSVAPRAAMLTAPESSRRLGTRWGNPQNLLGVNSSMDLLEATESHTSCLIQSSSNTYTHTLLGRWQIPLPHR